MASAMVGYRPWPFGTGFAAPTGPWAPTREDQIEMLKAQAEMLAGQLEQVRAAIEQLESGQSEAPE
jgi:hypothetical protein